MLALATSDATVDTTVKMVLKRLSNISFAIIFDSVAAGCPRVDSDLDIAVAASRVLEVAEKIAPTQALAEATGRPIDLIDLATMTEPPLLEQILQHGRRLFGTQFGNLIYRHVVDEADFGSIRRRISTERRTAWLGNYSSKS